MKHRAVVARLVAIILVLASGIGDWSPVSAQGNRKEVRPDQAIGSADPGLFTTQPPGTSFTYRVTLKKGRTFVNANGDGIRVNDVSGNLVVGAMRRISKRKFEVDFSSMDGGGNGSAAIRVNFTNKKGRLKFVVGSVTIRIAGGELVTIDARDRSIPQRLTLGNRPIGIGTAQNATENLQTAFVANNTGGTLSVVDVQTNTLLRTVAVGAGPTDVAISGIPGAQFAYVTNAASGTVSVVDAETFGVVATIPVGTDPQGIAVAGVDGIDEVLYVANRGSNNVSVISASSNTVIQTIPVGAAPTGVDVAGPPGAQAVVVTLADDNRVALISANSNMVITTVRVGSRPICVAVGGAQLDLIFVVNEGSNNVSLVNLNNQMVTNTIRVGSQPNCAVVIGGRSGEELYVTNRGDGTVSVIDVDEMVVQATISIGGRPREAARAGTTASDLVLVTN